MHSRKLIVPLLLLLTLGLAQFGFSQVLQSHTPKRTLGYVNPVTGAFEPLRQVTVPDALTPVTPTTGTLTFRFKITVKATIPANSVITCNANASVFEVSSGGVFEEEASALATGSGASWTCTAVIHYSWLLSTPGTDQVSFSTTTGLEYGFQVTATNGSQTLVVPVASRISSQPLSTIAVPATGASTTENISVTL